MVSPLLSNFVFRLFANVINLESVYFLLSFHLLELETKLELEPNLLTLIYNTLE